MNYVSSLHPQSDRDRVARALRSPHIPAAVLLLWRSQLCSAHSGLLENSKPHSTQVPAPDPLALALALTEVGRGCHVT